MKMRHQLLLSFAAPFFAILFSSLALVGCGGGGSSGAAAPSPVVTRTAILSGAQESPTPVYSGATGTGFVTVDPTTRAITGTVTFSGFTATAAHIHVAPAGSAPANNIVFGLTLGTNSAVVPSGIILTEAQYADLLAGNWYFNVHSAANPAGEIRGQIGRIVRVATLDGTQEVPSVITTASGSGIVSVHPVTRAITGTVTFSGVTATAAHIHVAPVGSNGGIVFGLTLGTNSAVVPSGIILTEAQYADLLAGNWYFNVHSAANPAGEIRGQINKL